MKRFPASRHMGAETPKDLLMITYDDQKLESFLLDELSSSEREEIEQRIFADDAIFARVEDIETDLIDAYVRGALAPDRRVRFEQFMQTNPSTQEKVFFARLLQKRLAANVLPFRKRYGFVIKGALAAILVVVVIGGPAMLKKVRSRTPVSPAAIATVVDATQVSPAVQPQETESLDATATDSAGTTEIPMVAASRPTTPPMVEEAPASTVEAARVVTFILSTLTVRSGGLSELALDDGIDVVTIRLPLETIAYQGYNVDLRDAAGRSIWTALRLSPSTVEGAPLVSLDVPAKAFAAGRHELVLAGIAGSGTEEIAYVEFDVRR
jgi:hypothetical protein